MLTISSANKDRILGGQAQLVTLKVTLANNASTSLTEADIMQGTFSIDRTSSNGTAVFIGGSTTSEMSFVIGDHDGRFKNIDLKGAVIDADLCLMINGVRTKVCDLGRYDVISAKRNGQLVSVVAFDILNRLDVMSVRMGDGNYTLTLGNILQNVSNQAFGNTTTIDFSSVSALCNSPSLAQFRYPKGNDVTLHNLVAWVAQLTGTIARAHGNQNKIQLIRNESSGATITVANRYNGRCDEKDVHLTGIAAFDANGVEYNSGSAGYELEIRSNGVFEQAYNQTNNTSFKQILVNNLWNSISTLRFRPFKASTLAMPWLECGDAVTYYDDEGTAHSSILTHVRYKLNGRMDLACECPNETEAKLDAAMPSRIKRSSISTEMLRLNALKSLNYVDASGDFSSAGTYFDLAKGFIKSKNFAIKEDGSAHFKGEITATSGNIGNARLDAGDITTEGTGLLLTSDESPAEIWIFPNKIWIVGYDTNIIFSYEQDEQGEWQTYVRLENEGGDDGAKVKLEMSQGVGKLTGTWTLNNRTIRTN